MQILNKLAYQILLGLMNTLNAFQVIQILLVI